MGVLTVTDHPKEKINAFRVLVGKYVGRGKHGSLVVHWRIIEGDQKSLCT
jgi:hypothetical protein